MGGIGSGGAREGAGRKALEGARVKVSARIPAWIMELVLTEADRRRVSVSCMITELLTKGLKV